MLCFYQGTYGERIEQSLESIRRIAPYVDRTIVIVDETVTEEQKQQLRDLGCEVYFHPWEDSMVKMRNQALEKIQSDDFVITADPDEWFNEQFCQDIRAITKKAEANQIDLILINSHDTTIKADLTEDSSISDFFKNLIYRKLEGTHYEGTGEIKEVHETLMIPGMNKTVRLDKNYWYEHIKYWHEVWERAARNVFLAGGGNNVGSRNQSWQVLRKGCQSLGITTWPHAREYFRKGNINIGLKEWLWHNRFEGFDYQHEMMEFGRWYFEYLHPEENSFEVDGKQVVWQPVTELQFGTPPEVMRFVEEIYMQTLGRHADQYGKEAYTKAILDKTIKREDLPQLLKQSPEYMEKVGGPTERIKLQVPVSVDIKINEGLIVEAMSRSKTWEEKIKPKIDVGTFLEAFLAEKYPRFIAWFYEIQPDLKEFIKKLKELT